MTTNNYNNNSKDSSGGSGSDSFIYNPNENLTISQQRLLLPVYEYKQQILYLLESYSTLIICGATGCGKSTQIPQYLFENGWSDGFRTIAVTQPRRVAAISLAERVSLEINGKDGMVGKTVGYAIRFDEKISDIGETRIKYMTDGMLIREMMLDPLLSKYPVIMVDEAHERTLSTDILMGLLKKVQKRRPDLKLIISSATLNAQEMFNYFNQNTTSDKSKDSCYILSIQGRTFPVDIHYLEQPTPDYNQKTLDTIVDIHTTQPPGDILVFLTGQEEIEKMINALDDRLEQFRQSQQQLQQDRRSPMIMMMKYNILPMFSGLSVSKQIKVFEKSADRVRKIIIATNIAETSITIDGIIYVVDCGFVKVKSYDPLVNLESLVIIPTSKSSANQRAGRAGRNRAGKCYRLYTQSSFEMLPNQSIPEIQRTSLVSVTLQLKALGIDNVLNFDFISPPPSITLVNAFQTLYGLGALDDEGKLTQDGTIMAEFPTEPSLSKMIIQSSSKQYNCSEEAITITAMLSIPGLFINHNHKSRKHLIVKEGDHLTLLNVFNSFISNDPSSPKWSHQHQINYKAIQRVLQVRKQLLAYASKYLIKLSSCLNDNNKNSDILIRKAIVSGFFTNVAQLQPDGSYQTIREKHKLWLHPTSVLCLTNSPQWVVFNDVIITTKEYMKEVTSIEPNWLNEIAPHYYKVK